MKCTFVVRLDWHADQPRRIAGSVEEVETGIELRFHSKDELIAFIAARNAAASNNSLENENHDQPKGRVRGAGEQEEPK
jgi:hypothetical protein